VAFPGAAEAWFLGLRLNEGVKVSALEMEFGREIVERAMEVAGRLAEDELLISDGRTVRLTAHGQLLSNDVFQEFLGIDGGEPENGPPRDRESVLSH